MIKLLRKIINVMFFYLPLYLRELIQFELVSKIGRMLTPELKVNKKNKNYINLGSGAIKYEGFINVDFFWGWGVDYGADLRYPLKIQSDVIDGIFCEHTLEHLTFETNDLLLKECYRILKPGATIRILVPDVSLFINNYCSNNASWFVEWEKLVLHDTKDPNRINRKMPTKMSSISVVTQEFGHVSAWDFETMQYYLKKNHFKNIKQSSYRTGDDKNLLIDLDSNDRKLVTLYVEATK